VSQGEARPQLRLEKLTIGPAPRVDELFALGFGDSKFGFGFWHREGGDCMGTVKTRYP